MRRGWLNAVLLLSGLGVGIACAEATGKDSASPPEAVVAVAWAAGYRTGFITPRSSAPLRQGTKSCVPPCISCPAP